MLVLGWGGWAGPESVKTVRGLVDKLNSSKIDCMRISTYYVRKKDEIERAT